MASLGFTITQVSQDIANNTSNVTITLTLYSTNKDWNNYTSGPNAPTGRIIIDGVSRNFTNTFDLRNKTSQAIYTTNVNIAHGSDGTKTLYVSASFDGKTAYTSSLSTSDSKTLTKINRGSATLRVTLTQDSQNIANNTSTVTAKVYMDTTAYVTASISNAAGTLTLDGTNYQFTKSIAAAANKTYEVYSKTITITHAANGKKTVSASAKYNTGTYLGNLTASSTSKELTQIPRPTQPTTDKSKYAYGENIVISMPRNVSSVTHTVQAGVDGTKSWTDIATGRGTSYTWTFPKTWAQYLTDSSKKLRIRVISYSGGTNLGSKEVSPQLTITPTSDMAPVVAITHSDVNTAVYNKFGGYVDGKSKIKMTVTTTLYQNTTIASGTAKLGTQQASFTAATYNLTATNNVSATSTTLSATVKDKRGLSGSKTVNVSAFSYALPSASKLVVSRCNQDGSANDEGAYAKITYSASVHPVNNRNDKSLKLEYKKDADSRWTSQTLPMNAYTVENQTIIIPADTENSYDIKITVTDYFTSSVLEKRLSAAFVLMDFHSSGRGITFGKVAEFSNRFECAIQGFFRNGLHSSGSWLAIRNTDSTNKFETLYFQNDDTDTGPYLDGTFIRAYNVNNLGQNLIIKAGGNFVAGGGEYASNRYSDGLESLTGEDTYIGADQNVYIEPNSQTIGDKKRWIFNRSGNIVSPVGAEVVLGGTETTRLEFWSNTTNKIGIGAINSTDNKKYELLAKSDRLRLYNGTDSAVIWDMIPPSVIATGGNMGVASKSVDTATWTEVGSYTFSPGTYIVMCYASFASNATGVRRLGLHTTPGVEGGGWGWNDTNQAVNGCPTVCQIQGIIKVTSSTMYYLNAYQNSGGALSCNPRWHCVKIG